MGKGKSYPDWKEKVLEWKASGTSTQVWCKEQQIPYTTFLGWKKRLESTLPKTKPGFIELKDQMSSSSGIVLEYNGIKIHLTSTFDKIVLKQCLDCLRDILC